MRDAAELFKALGDETRLHLLWLLAQHGELCVCDLMAVLEITQSKASRHLRTLYHAGLVNDRRVGLWVNYSLRRDLPPLGQAVLRALTRSLADDERAQALLEALARRLAQKRACCAARAAAQ